MSNEFKNKALLNDLKGKYIVDLVSEPDNNLSFTKYTLKLNIDNVFLYSAAHVFAEEDETSFFIRRISETIDEFYKFIKDGARDINYFSHQVQLKAQFEFRENLYSPESSSDFVDRIYYKHDMNVLNAMRELEETTLEPYLKKKRVAQ